MSCRKAVALDDELHEHSSTERGSVCPKPMFHPIHASADCTGGHLGFGLQREYCTIVPELPTIDRGLEDLACFSYPVPYYLVCIRPSSLFLKHCCMRS